MKNLGIILVALCVMSVLWGCDPLTVHKVSSTIFDGVPSLPPADQYCQDYHEKKVAEQLDASKKKSTAETSTGSSHPPYKAKKCNNCHDKSKDSGLIKPKDEICFVCHPKILDKPMMHGPAAVGGCLECHDPHSTNNPSLLKVEKAKVCAVCHKERRMAAEMHDKVVNAGMMCTDCHNPHAGDAKYFLR